MACAYKQACDVTKISETVVDMTLVSNSPSLSDVSNGVTVSMNGNTVNFIYSKKSTTEYDMIYLNGSLTGNTLTLDDEMYTATGNGIGTFTGSK